MENVPALVFLALDPEPNLELYRGGTPSRRIADGVGKVVAVSWGDSIAFSLPDEAASESEADIASRRNHKQRHRAHSQETGVEESTRSAMAQSLGDDKVSVLTLRLVFNKGMHIVSKNVRLHDKRT